jgi:hypothetical protein
MPSIPCLAKRNKKNGLLDPKHRLCCRACLSDGNYGLTFHKTESKSGSYLMAVCQTPQPSGKPTHSQLIESRSKE